MAYIGQSPKVKRIRYTPQSTIPANPAEGDLYYSDGTPSAEGLYLYKNGDWESVEGSGAGGINYIENSNAESALTGYATYDDGASSIPVDGSGGTASNITFSRNTSSPLRGIADFDFAKSASDAQGEGVSYDFTIDEADQASILRVSFDYSVSADYADADMGVFIYDVTNANLIRMSKENIDATSLNSNFVSEFQSAPDSTSYRLIFHVQSTNASAYNFNFDNVNVGPRSITRGPIVTDFITETATGSWTTNTTAEISYKRVGDTLEAIVSFEWTGAPDAWGIVDLPAGLSIDTDKILQTDVFSNQIGSGMVYDSSGVAQPLFISYENPTTVRINFITASTNQITPVTTSSPYSLTSGDLGQIEFKVPIEGWSSNSTISEDFGSRIIAFSSTFAATPCTSGISTILDVVGNNYDTVGMSSSVNNNVEIPESGIYSFSASIPYDPNATGNRSVVYRVNGGSDVFIANYTAVATGAVTTVTANWELELEKGDTIQLRAFQNSGSTIFATANTVFSGFKLQSPQTLTGSETIAARYTSSAGQSIPDSTFTTVLYGNKTFDTHGSYNPSTGVYTFSKSGFYTLKQQIGFATINVTADQKINVGYLINSGTTQITGEYSCDATNTGIDITVGGSDTIQVSAGDTIEFQCSQGLGGATNLSTDPTRNYFSIIKN